MGAGIEELERQELALTLFEEAGERKLLWHGGCAGLGEIWNVQEEQVDLSAQSRVS